VVPDTTLEGAVTQEELDLKNGANLIVLNERGEFLVVKEKTRKRMWMLPGGEVERGESSRHAAVSETEEETKIVVDECDLRLIGIFVQRPKGFVFLYETKAYKGEVAVPVDSLEVSEARFMSLEEIRQINEAGLFRTGYMRMILRYLRCVYNIDQTPYEGRLSDEVEFPLDPEFYRNNVLVV